MNSNEMNELLKCQLCTKQYSLDDRPRMLPCGRTVCNRCFLSLEPIMPFRCDLCHNQHSHTGSFIVNQTILNLIHAKPTSRANSEFKSDLKDLELLSNELVNDLDQGEIKIKQHCNQLRHKIQQSAEDKLKKLHEITKLNLQSIDDYEKGLIDAFKANSDLVKSTNNLIEEIKNFIQESSKYLSKYKFDDEHSIREYQHKLEGLKYRVEKQKKFINYILFNKELLEFEMNCSELNENMLGNYYFKEIKQKEPLVREKKFMHKYVTCFLVYREDKILFGTSHGEVKLIKINSSNCLDSFRAHKSDVMCLCMISNDRFISGSKDGTMKIFDLALKECVRIISTDSSWITCLKMISNDQFLSASSDGVIKIYDMNSWSCIKTFADNSGWVYSLQLLPDYKIIIGSNTQVKIWDLDLAKCTKTLTGHSSSINSIQLVSSKKAISSAFKEIIVWNLDTGQAEKILNCHESWIKCLKVINSTIFLSGSFDNTIKMWNIQSGECVKTFVSHQDSIWCMDLLSYDKFISVSRDNTIKIWDINSANCLQTIHP